jgi:hypothetical protein
MQIRGIRLLVALAFLWAVAILPGRAFADEPRQAGLVIQFADGRTETRCVTLQGEEVTGADLLMASGLDLNVDASSGMGITVCQIEGEGCNYPAEPCFCQCMGGGECAYWNYFFRDPGADGWTYSALGAILHKIDHGSLEGWVWGNGHTPPADQITFDTVCAPSTATPTNTPEPPVPTGPAATATPTESLSPTGVPTVLPRPTVSASSPTPSPTPDAGQTLASYWPFGLAVLGLALIAVVVRLQRT